MPIQPLAPEDKTLPVISETDFKAFRRNLASMIYTIEISKDISNGKTVHYNGGNNQIAILADKNKALELFEHVITPGETIGFFADNYLPKLLSLEVAKHYQNAIKHNQPKNIEDLKQFMQAFSVFADAISKDNPTLEDIFDSLEPLIFRPKTKSFLEKIIPPICALIGAIITAPLVGLIWVLTVLCTEDDGNHPPLRDLLPENYDGITMGGVLLASLIIAFTMPLVPGIGGIVGTFGLIFTAGIALAVFITGTVKNFNPMYNKTYDCASRLFFFQPPEDQQKIRTNFKNFVTLDGNTSGTAPFKAFLMSDQVKFKPVLQPQDQKQQPSTSSVDINIEKKQVVENRLSEIRNRMR